jgi:tRNA(Ile)-lysidine synthase TilS/MesJ
MKPLSSLNKGVDLFRPLLDIKKKFLIKISKITFKKFIVDPSNKDKNFLRTRVRSLKKHLENSGIKYDQIFKSIENLSSSKDTLDKYLVKVFKELIRKDNKKILINFNKYKILSTDTKIELINLSVKQLKKNYYDLRSKKVKNLIKSLNKKGFKKATLGGCIFSKKGLNLCLEVEKIKNS